MQITAEFYSEHIQAFYHRQAQADFVKVYSYDLTLSFKTRCKRHPGTFPSPSKVVKLQSKLSLQKRLWTGQGPPEESWVSTVVIGTHGVQDCGISCDFIVASLYGRKMSYDGVCQLGLELAPAHLAHFLQHRVLQPSVSENRCRQAYTLIGLTIAHVTHSKHSRQEAG